METIQRWLVWLAFVAVWTWGLLMPDPGGLLRSLFFPDIPDTGGGPSFRLSFLKIIQSPLFSKSAHIAGYAVLAVLSGWLRAPWKRRWLLLAFLSVHAAATEYLQAFQPTRHPSWGDVGFDHLGAALGLALTWKWWLDRSNR